MRPRAAPLHVPEERASELDSRPDSGWTTASVGHAPDTSPAELRALGEHLDGCRGTGGPLFALRCRAEQLRRFAAARIVTSLVVVGSVVVVVLVLV